MKKAFKATFGSLLALGVVLPSAVLAHSHNDPFLHLAAWVEGTYYKPSNNGLSVGDQLFANTGGSPSGAGLFDGGRRAVFLEPDNDFDYALGFSYHMPHSQTRLFFSYDHYNNDIDDNGQIDVRNLGISPGVVPDVPAGNGAAGTTFGISSYDLSSHEFRVGAIHDLHFGDRFCLDLLAFLEYDKLRQTLHERITGMTIGIPAGVAPAVPAAPINRVRETESKLRGFGPGVGLMTRWYSHHPHWHVFFGGNATLLTADNDYSQTFFATPTDFYIYEPEETDSVVGKLDILFGINYHCALHEMHGMQWDISLGMHSLNLFYAFKNGNTAFSPNGGAGAGVPNNFTPNLGVPQDWSRFGPFLKFRVGGHQA